MKRFIKTALAAVTANAAGQRLLERLVVAMQWLMGVGSGAVAESSGEQVVVKLLRQNRGVVGQPLVFYFFEEHGSFELSRITPSGYLTRVERYRDTLEQFRNTNFLARRKAGPS